jgi:hypothetical protein
MGVGREVEKCIIMHVWDGFWRKVHYSALFGARKKTRKALNAEFAEALRKDLRKIREEKSVKQRAPPA